MARPPENWKKLRQRLEDDGGLHEPQRPSPEGLHAQQLHYLQQAKAQVDDYCAAGEREDEFSQEGIVEPTPVPWDDLREAVRAEVRRITRYGDPYGLDHWDDDAEDDLVESVCVAALREVDRSRYCAAPCEAETETDNPDAPPPEFVLGGKPLPDDLLDRLRGGSLTATERPPTRCRIGLHRWLPPGPPGYIGSSRFPRCARCGKTKT